MKLKKALKIAYKNNLSHVAVDRDNKIYGYFTFNGVKQHKGKWAFTKDSDHNEMAILGTYTGTKRWTSTLRLTALGDLINIVNIVGPS